MSACSQPDDTSDMLYHGSPQLVIFGGITYNAWVFFLPDGGKGTCVDGQPRFQLTATGHDEFDVTAYSSEDRHDRPYPGFNGQNVDFQFRGIYPPLFFTYVSTYFTWWTAVNHDTYKKYCYSHNKSAATPVYYALQGFTNLYTDFAVVVDIVWSDFLSDTPYSSFGGSTPKGSFHWEGTVRGWTQSAGGNGEDLFPGYPPNHPSTIYENNLGVCEIADSVYLQNVQQIYKNRQGFSSPRTMVENSIEEYSFVPNRGAHTDGYRFIKFTATATPVKSHAETNWNGYTDHCAGEHGGPPPPDPPPPPGGESGGNSAPHNLHDDFGFYHAVAVKSGKVRYWQCDTGNPAKGWQVADIEVADGDYPRIAVDYRGLVFVAYIHSGAIDIKRSDDNGKTWNGAYSGMIAGAKTCEIFIGEQGTQIVAGYVETVAASGGVLAHGVIKGAVKEAGDTAFSATFTFKKDDGTDLIVADTAVFGISQAKNNPAQFFLHVMQANGTTGALDANTSHWSSEDQCRTWTKRA